MPHKITGTLIKNFFHCKRQAYLYYYGLNFSNEFVNIGEIMHKEQKPKEYIFEKIKIDDIKGNYIIEYKKTSSNMKGTRIQLIYYLDYFHKKGLILKGLIKDLTYDNEHIIDYDKDAKEELKEALNAINDMLDKDMPPRQKLKKNCRGCSFKDYCWIE